MKSWARGVISAAARPLRVRGQVAVLPLFGVHRTAHGDGDADLRRHVDGSLRSRVRRRDEEPDVGAIVIDCDSPGGSVSGVPELAAKIFKARGKGKRSRGREFVDEFGGVLDLLRR
jgi:ClpP class serine protease